jgi:hypothetical protein
MSPKNSRTRCVRRSHPVITQSSLSHPKPKSPSTKPAFTTFHPTSRRRATTTTAAALPPSSAAAAMTTIVPAFELAARVKAPFHSPVPSEALAALVLATALIALLGRDENNLLLATVAFRAMSGVGAIAQWWLSPTGQAVAFGVLAIKTFLSGGGIRVVRGGRDLFFLVVYF